MQLIAVDDLITYKVLPFDLYTEKGKKIFTAGEILTPGKILQLKYIPSIYIEEIDDSPTGKNIENEEDIIKALEDWTEDEDEEASSEKEGSRLHPQFIKEIVKTPFIERVQTEIKDKYVSMMDCFTAEGIKDPSLCLEIRDNIIDELIPEVNRILYKSELKIAGDYNYCHAINVATFSAILAIKMKFNEQAVKDITLAAMLHDIGKIEIPDSVLNKTTLTPSELKLVKLHTKLGYNMIKNELGLPETVAKVALQHHEKPDGTGYPFGISGKLISTESYIVSICNEFDKLTSGRGEVKVKNYKEAVRYLLETGSKHYKSDVLYTFVYMTNYNDISPIIAEAHR